MGVLVELQSDIVHEHILKDIIIQLNKDLVLSNVGFEFNPEMEFNDFWIELNAVVRELLNKHYEKYLHFIYRIDLEERDLLVNDIAPFEDVEAFVAFQILKRVYKKVYFRKNYANNS